MPHAQRAVVGACAQASSKEARDDYGTLSGKSTKSQFFAKRSRSNVPACHMQKGVIDETQHAVIEACWAQQRGLRVEAHGSGMLLTWKS